MNYELELSQSNPYSFNALNGTVPPLVSGAGSATLLTSTNTSSFPAFQVNREHISFSLEVWFLPVQYSGVETTVIGHNDEGIMWNGSRFTLRVRKGGEVVEDSWIPQQISVFHVVMTYDTVKAAMWVNGQRVLEVDVPVGAFAAADGTNVVLNHRVGGTATGIYDSMATYLRALNETEVVYHYAWGNEVMDASTIAMRKGATTWSLAYREVDVRESVIYSGDRFNEGLFVNLSVVDNLIPDSSDGGVWQISVPVGLIVDGTTTAGLHVTYEGYGVTLSYSTDATSWTVINNKTTILEDATVTDTIAYIRLSVSGEGWVSSLRIDALNTRVMAPLSGSRPLNFKSVSMDQTVGNQLDFQSDWGADFRSGAMLTVPRDENSEVIGTVEMWVKVNSYGEGTLLDGELANGTGAGWVNFGAASTSPNSGTLYVNGVQGSPVLELGLWYHVVFVEATAANLQLFVGRGRYPNAISAGLTVGHLAVYSSRLTASEVQTLYKFNTGAPALRVDDTSAVTLTEENPAVGIYAYSWSYVSGGR